jgi:UDP-2,4-diacetamido-2,4,6-trideoxy-beta-L-altropyranose hydrolase
VGDRPRVLLVTSGDATEGRGHVSRTVTLARALGSGAAVAVSVLRGGLTPTDESRLAGAGAVRAPGLPEPAGFDVVVVDLPDPNEPVGPCPAERLVVFDDGARFRGAAAIVVQPSLPSWAGPGWADRILAGSAVAPIRPEIRRLAADPPPTADPPEVVVCFGGSDPFDVTSRLVPAVAGAVTATADPPRAAVVAIVGPGYRGGLGADGRWTLLRDPDDLDRRLAAAQLAVIGAGTMKLEVAHLGIPALLVAASDDQLPVAEPFAATGAARYLGDGRTIDPGEVATAVSTLLADEGTRRAMGEAGRAAVDGRGADRVAAAILEIATRP